MSINNYSRSLEIQTRNLFGEYLDDESINEICYNGDGAIWTQNNKGLWTEHQRNISFEQIMAFSIALASYKEDTLKNNKPVLSATLNTGERVQVVIPPVTKKFRISVTIRKPSRVRYTMEDYKKQGMFDNAIRSDEKMLTSEEKNLINLFEKKEWDSFLLEAIRQGKNIVIAGATGSGKTTFMKSLIDYIPDKERIITIEDTEEISFYNHKNYVQLFYPSEAKESDSITSTTLLKSSLRMKPDRILLAELRGAEAYEYLNILNSGHGGSITSIHAGGIEQAFYRLSSMVELNSQVQNIPFEVIKKSLQLVIDVIIHIENIDGIRHFGEVYYKGFNDGKYQ